MKALKANPLPCSANNQPCFEVGQVGHPSLIAFRRQIVALRGQERSLGVVFAAQGREMPGEHLRGMGPHGAWVLAGLVGYGWLMVADQK